MIRSRLTRFLSDEDGAVTADWVVLVGAVVVLGALCVHIIGQGATTASDDLASALQDAGVPTLNFDVISSGATSGASTGSGSVAP